jgi:hypothetical protein
METSKTESISSPQYLTDAQGNKIAVVLEIETYQKLLDELEELEAIRAYDEAISSDDEEIPFEEAILPQKDEDNKKVCNIII